MRSNCARSARGRADHRATPAINWNGDGHEGHDSTDLAPSAPTTRTDSEG